jgi:ABC-type Mn2+/Zn2+ transport system permease subunit
MEEDTTTMIDGLIHLIIDPLSYPFIVRGLIAAIIVGTVCSVLGTYVVLRRMAFFGDALAHTILPGVAIGYLLGGGAHAPLFWGGLVAGILASLGIGTITRGGEIKEDTAIGIIFAGMFALGIAIISTVRSYTVDLSHFLFGDVLGVGPGDLWLSGVFGAVVLILIFVLYKEFLVVSFDPILAATLRLPVELLRYLLLLMIAITIVVSIQTVGVALMVAMLVTPAATAYLLTRRLPTMMIISAIIGVTSAVGGLYFSFYVNVASGAAIVLLATAIFVLTFVLAPHRGLLWVRIRSKQINKAHSRHEQHQT